MQRKSNLPLIRSTNTLYGNVEAPSSRRSVRRICQDLCVHHLFWSGLKYLAQFALERRAKFTKTTVRLSEGTSLGSQRVGWYVEVCVWWGTALVLSVFLLFSPHWCPPPPSALRMFARATLMCMSAAFYHTLSFWSEFPWRNITIWMRSIARQQYVLDYPAWWSERREHGGRRDFKVP